MHRDNVLLDEGQMEAIAYVVRNRTAERTDWAQEMPTAERDQAQLGRQTSRSC